jgi:hypothetical protein
MVIDLYSHKCTNHLAHYSLEVAAWCIQNKKGRSESLLKSEKIYLYFRIYLMDSPSANSARIKKDSVICPWCKTYFETRPGTNCTNCGGNLPPPAGAERGQAPPIPPRMFPSGYRTRMILYNNWRIFIGGAFALFSFPTSFGAIIFQAPFYGGGLYMVWLGYKKGVKNMEILEHGKSAEGLVVEAGENKSIEVNEKHPYFIKYEYEVDGKKYTGSINCYDESSTSFQAGDPVWVVYLPGEAEHKSSLWPPVA